MYIYIRDKIYHIEGFATMCLHTILLAVIGILKFRRVSNKLVQHSPGSNGNTQNSSNVGEQNIMMPTSEPKHK